MVKNTWNDLSFEENFSSYQELTLKSLLITYLIMTRESKEITSLKNILEEKIRQTKNISDIQMNYDNWIEILLSHIYHQYPKEDIFSKVIHNYLEEGFLFHTFHASFLESITEKGLQTVAQDDKMDLVRKIFVSHGKKDIFGFHTGKNYHTIFLASSLKSSSYYGLNSPSFFKMFIHNEIEKKESYTYENYLDNIRKLCQKYQLSLEEAKIVLDYFEESYLKYSPFQYPCIALIPRKKYTQTKLLPKLPKETEKDYLKRMIRLNTENNVMIKENIHPSDLTFISYDHRKEKRRRVK